MRLGIDVLADGGFAQLAGLRIGLLTNESSRDGSGRRTVEVLSQAPNVRLVALFSPEHGLGADKDGKVASGRHAATGLPIHSLYGQHRKPRSAMLSGLDAVVIDLQDVGVRFYTYATTMGYMLEAASRHRLKVFILDRPNPIGAAGVRGPMLDADLTSFTAYFPMPVQHGMTMGELGRMFQGELGLKADLAVVSMQGYRREAWFDETGLAWVNPSPNLPTLRAAVLYPGVALIEFTDVSVGRGTATPFEVVGAPWIDSAALARHLRAQRTPGLEITPEQFTPAADPHKGMRCHGIRIRLMDRTALDAPRLGIELASALHQLHRNEFSLRKVQTLLGSRQTLSAIEARRDPAAIAQDWRADVDAFSSLRSKYLIY